MTMHRLAAAAPLKSHASAAFFVAALVAAIASSAAAQAPNRAPKVSAAAGKQAGKVEMLPDPETSSSVRFAPIGDITLDTAISPGLFPPNLAAEAVGVAPYVLAPGMERLWTPQAFCWIGVPMRYAPTGRFGIASGPHVGHDVSCAQTVPHESGGEAAGHTTTNSLPVSKNSVPSRR